MSGPGDLLRKARTTRRVLLRGGTAAAGALGGGALLAACGGSGAPSPTLTTSSGATTATDADVTVVRLAASIEATLVSAYQSLLDAAGRGALGAVPPALATLLTTARMQHAGHASAWNSALTGAGRTARTAPDPHYRRIVDQALPGLRTVADAARLALGLETVALETCTAGAALVTDPRHRLVALTIAPVEAQHVAVLRLLLGEDPVPDSLVRTDSAASPGDLTAAGG